MSEPNKQGNLVIGLKVGDTLDIGDVRIVVMSRDGQWVRLSIKAPKEIPVTRQNTGYRDPRGKK